VTGFETVVKYATPDLGYIVEIECFRAKLGSSEEAGDVSCGRPASSGAKTAIGKSCIDTLTR